MPYIDTATLLAHLPLPEIDDHDVWRLAVIRVGEYRQRARALLS